MQVTVDLRNVSNLAYRVKNLQVTAFIQDPQDRTRLTPLATLVPDNEPDEGFTLGPFVSNRGPLIFSNSTIVPILVESLMANSSGLIFRISNYDIVNEDGRNFAFISQDVVERTGQVVIDFGGARSLRAQVSGETIDENQPGDETEIHRVSTSAGQTIDTNFDGAIDDADRRATFDATGKEVGVTLFEALSAIGLQRFEARRDPLTGRYVDYVPGEDQPVDVSASTEEDRILNSYSTFVDDSGRERIFRIRGVANDLIIQKYWEILTPLGIDQQTDLDQLILKTDSPISLNFVQDLDGDLLPADVEYLLRTTDTPLPFGSVVPGSTDIVADLVRFNTDPGLATGTLVRVAADRGGLMAGTNYFLHNLGGGSYSFYNSLSAAVANTSRVDLTGNITTGIFRPITPTVTNVNADSVTFDPGLATTTRVRVLATGGGLTANTDYFLRNRGGGSYSFYDTSAHASATTETGRIDLTGNIAAGLFNPADPTRVYYSTFTDFISRSVTFDPRYATATGVRVIATGGGLASGTDYFLRNLGGGSYGFYDIPANALAGNATGRINLTGNITAGVFSLTAHGRDTDRDGLDDRFEALIGWTVSTPLRTYTVYSAPNRRDSNFDTPKTGVDNDSVFDSAGNLIVGDGIEDRLEFDGADGNVAPGGWDDKNNNRLRDRFEVFQVDANDFVLDAIRKDTDEDGIHDATEIVGFLIEPIDAPKTMKHIARTDPTNPFTDSDTFIDGFEKLVGLDPTDGSDTDEDGDGLPDRVEIISGWLVRTFGISTSPFEQSTPTTVIGFSRIDSEDSDDDGLTDYEEFFLKTNAQSRDTDGDGIEDRIEHLGFALGHKVGDDDIGIIKTNPLDADTDNDLRSDGAEAELVDIELARWVVRATGAVKSGEGSTNSAYRVFSNPLVADDDYDGLVDGEEYGDFTGDYKLDPRDFYFNDAQNDVGRYRTDPNSANTDGDKRDDGVEVRGGTSPLVEDIRVTVVAKSVEFTNPQGNYEVAITVKPPGIDVGGLAPTALTVFEGTNKQVGKLELRTFLGGQTKVSFRYYVNGVPFTTGPATTVDGHQFLTFGEHRAYNPGANGVPLNARFQVIADNRPEGTGFFASQEFVYTGNASAVHYDVGDGGFNTPTVLPPVNPLNNVPIGSRSVAFGLANDERFSIEGQITVITATGNTTVNLGGLEGLQAFKASPSGTPTSAYPVFSYFEVADKFIEEYYFDVTLGNGVKMKINFFYIIG